MKQRVISSVVISLMLIALLIFNSTFPVLLNISIGLASAFCVHELIVASGLLKHWMLYFPSISVAFALPLFGIFNVSEMLVVYAFYSFIMFTSLIIYHRSVTFKDLAIIYSMSILIPSALQTIVLSRELNSTYGMIYAILSVVCAWIPDIGAFLVGVNFGKTKLCPEISPKKTVEGLFGGIGFSVVLVLAIGVVSSLFYFGDIDSISYVPLIILGLLAPITATIGDLSFSLIKRSCGIKDFGQIIPGHGGLLDRFDSVTFTAPLVFLVLSYFPMFLS